MPILEKAWDLFQQWVEIKETGWNPWWNKKSQSKVDGAILSIWPFPHRYMEYSLILCVTVQKKATMPDVLDSPRESPTLERHYEAHNTAWARQTIWPMISFRFALDILETLYTRVLYKCFKICRTSTDGAEVVLQLQVVAIHCHALLGVSIETLALSAPWLPCN